MPLDDVLVNPKVPTLLIRSAVAFKLAQQGVQEASSRMTTMESKGAGTKPEERKDLSLQTRGNRVKTEAIRDML